MKCLRQSRLSWFIRACKRYAAPVTQHAYRQARLQAIWSNQCQADITWSVLEQGGDPSWQDVYAAEVQTVSTSGFTVNVARLDKLVSDLMCYAILPHHRGYTVG